MGRGERTKQVRVAAILCDVMWLFCLQALANRLADIMAEEAIKLQEVNTATSGPEDRKDSKGEADEENYLDECL